MLFILFTIVSCASTSCLQSTKIKNQQLEEELLFDFQNRMLK